MDRPTDSRTRTGRDLATPTHLLTDDDGGVAGGVDAVVTDRLRGADPGLPVPSYPCFRSNACMNSTSARMPSSGNAL